MDNDITININNVVFAAAVVILTLSKPNGNTESERSKTVRRKRKMVGTILSLFTQRPRSVVKQD